MVLQETCGPSTVAVDEALPLSQEGLKVDERPFLLELCFLLKSKSVHVHLRHKVRFLCT
jgi:hypothetical protein